MILISLKTVTVSVNTKYISITWLIKVCLLSGTVSINPGIQKLSTLRKTHIKEDSWQSFNMILLTALGSTRLGYPADALNHSASKALNILKCLENKSFPRKHVPKTLCSNGIPLALLLWVLLLILKFIIKIRWIGVMMFYTQSRFSHLYQFVCSKMVQKNSHYTMFHNLKF